MAATSGGAGAGADEFLTRKLGPLPVWVWAGLGVALALYASRKKKSSSSSSGTNAMSVLQSPFGYSAAAQQQAAALGGSSLGAYYPIGYSDYSSVSDLAGVLSNLSSQITSLGAGNSGTNQSPAPSPGNTQTGAANQTAPAPGGTPSVAPAGPPAGWQRIPDPHAGSLISGVLGAGWITSGNTQYYNPGQVVKISTPQEGANLLKQGYNVVGFGGTEYYNPQAKATPGAAVFKT